MSCKILLIDGHPDAESFCAALAAEYVAGAQERGREVKRVTLRELKFDPLLHYGYRQPQELEPDLIKVQALIKECTHLVLVTPVWWGSLPGLLKGFIDRTFVRDFSHRFDPKKKLPEKLLRGRSVTTIYTQSSPWWYTKFIIGENFWRTLRRSIFDFVGFAPVQRFYFDKVKGSSPERRQEMLARCRELGRRGA